MSPDVYPPNGYLSRPSNDQHLSNNYLPSVSYSLDHLDRLDLQVLLDSTLNLWLCVLIHFEDCFMPNFMLSIFNPGSGNVALPAKLRELSDWLLQHRA